MGWHLSGDKRTRIRVIGVHFVEFLSQEKEMRFRSESNLVLSKREFEYPSSSSRPSKINEKWDEFQRKLDLVPVSREFELS